MHRSIDVVIPVHNGWALTEACLEHLRSQTLPHTVIVCDNGSTDGTPESLRITFPDARLIELGANVGFPTACNRGVRAGSGDIVVLLNNDVECRPDFLEHLVAPGAVVSAAAVAAIVAVAAPPGAVVEVTAAVGAATGVLVADSPPHAASTGASSMTATPRCNSLAKRECVSTWSLLSFFGS